MTSSRTWRVISSWRSLHAHPAHQTLGMGHGNRAYRVRIDMDGNFQNDWGGRGGHSQGFVQAGKRVGETHFDHGTSHGCDPSRLPARCTFHDCGHG